MKKLFISLFIVLKEIVVEMWKELHTTIWNFLKG